jgi:DNA-binding NtrC family response regulator
MPKMDGFALASVLQGEVPGMKVVLMSGYASDSEIPAETIQNITARLKKPLSLHQLAEAMKEALD